MALLLFVSAAVFRFSFLLHMRLIYRHYAESQPLPDSSFILTFGIIILVAKELIYDQIDR